jgi:[CysO sulfur-carrier protein]-S-L-cysteine hydrolase
MVKIRRSVYEAMVAHALANREIESCGMLAGHGDAITHGFPAENVAEQQRTRYEISSEDIVRIVRREIEDQGLEHLGIYHSHVASRAYPSRTDIRLAYYPVLYVVISLAEPERPVVRAFRIEKDHPDAEDEGEGATVTEDAIEIIP